MNKSTLYFRSIDIISISYLIAIVYAFINATYNTDFTMLAFLNTISLIFFIALIISTVIFKIAKKDDYARDLIKQSFEFTGRFIIYLWPILFIVGTFISGFIDGLLGRPFTKDFFLNITVSETLHLGWLIAIATYLCAFNFYRFRGMAS